RARQLSWRRIMKKLSMLGIIVGAALLSAAPFSLQWSQKNVALSLDSADARVGRPLTATSVAGVHRRAHRRAYRHGHYYYYERLGRPVRWIKLAICAAHQVRDESTLDGPRRAGAGRALGTGCAWLWSCGGTGRSLVRRYLWRGLCRDNYRSDRRLQ